MELKEYEDYIDTDLSNEVRRNTVSEELRELPFIGKKYNRDIPDKILILGKSAYNWGKNEEEKKEIQEKHLSNSLGCIEGIIWNNFGIHRWNNNERIPEFQRKKFARSLERIFFKTKDIYAEEFESKRKKLWGSICFHQLIQEPMPTWTHKDNATTRKEGFLKLIRIIDILKPNHIVMMSNHYKYQNSFMKVLGVKEKSVVWGSSNGSDIRSNELVTGNSNFNFTSLVHPSSSKSNFIEQNDLLQKVMPNYLKYLNG